MAASSAVSSARSLAVRSAVALALALILAAFGVAVLALHTLPTYLHVPNARWQPGDYAWFLAGPTALLASLWLTVIAIAARGR